MSGLQLAAVALVLLAGDIVQGLSINRFPTRLGNRSSSVTGPFSRTAEDTKSEPNYRLPNNTSPSHYDITLSTKVHIGDLSFKGVVVITMNVDEDFTKNIVVHARQLQNFNSTLIDTVTTKSKKLNSHHDNVTEFLTLTPEDNSKLVKGRTYTLIIAYDGNLRLHNAGFYLSNYTNSIGDTVYLATTQFESTNARHGFPCYDEPAKKATFTITINHSPKYSAISNMPVDTTKSYSGQTVFLKTLKMSTYLVAFIVSDFEYTSSSLNGFTQRIFYRPGMRTDLEFALFSGVRIAAHLAEYFDVPFALPKLDHVAVPHFYASGMENWGVIIYNEENVNYNAKYSTTVKQAEIASLIAHECAHMWFGNLVTFKWWTYLWLKEGFATMFEFKAVNEVYPEWDMMQFFIVYKFQNALSKDGFNHPHAMTHYVQKQNEIEQLFDDVSYDKAAAVLFMWQHAITDNIFRAGITKYLRLNEITAAEEDDLFDAMDCAAKRKGAVLPNTMKIMMGSWTNKGGFPLLTVKRNYRTGAIQITQNAFYNDPSYENDAVWYVPVNYATSKYSDFRNTTAKLYLNNTRSIQVVDKQLGPDDWIILNKQSTGYYRVQYDDRNWNLISDTLLSKLNLIHPLNRAALMDDAYHLSTSKKLKHSILLHLMTYLRNEEQYAPWATAKKIIIALDAALYGDLRYDKFKSYVGDLVGNIYERLGFEEVSGESNLQKEVRKIAIELACIAGIESCLTKTKEKLKWLVRDGIEIEPNLREVVFCNGLTLAEDTEFNFIYNRLMRSNSTVERRMLISSLGCSRNANHVKKFIESSISYSRDVTLNLEERLAVLNSAYTRGEVGLIAAIEFLGVNYSAYAKLTSDQGKPKHLYTALTEIAYYISNEYHVAKVRALVKMLKSQSDVSNIIEIESTVEYYINLTCDWLETNGDPIMNWIIQYGRSPVDKILANIIPFVTDVYKDALSYLKVATQLFFISL